MVRRRQQAAGYMMIMALLLIALMMTGGVLLAGSLQVRMRLLRQEVESIQLSALTDAGVALALDRLSVAPFDEIALEQNLGDGRIEVSAPLGEQVMIRVVSVTARVAGAGRAVRAVVQLSDDDPPRVVAWRRTVVGPGSRNP